PQPLMVTTVIEETAMAPLPPPLVGVLQWEAVVTVPIVVKNIPLLPLPLPRPLLLLPILHQERVVYTDLIPKQK
ncbi:hypothetical protein BGZ76_004349, partial [Entomortierella beljakovae]